MADQYFYGTDPQHVHPALQRGFHMLRCGHLHHCQQTGALPGFGQPRQGGLARALKATGPGAGLPHARAEHLHLWSMFHDPFSGGQHLLTAFSTARACNDQGSINADAPIGEGNGLDIQ